jgi:hypothetical protein
VVALKLVFLTPVVIINMVDLLPFPFKALFLCWRRNSTTLDFLLYVLNYCHSVSGLLCRTTYHMLVV